jgi:hypothetical protein
VSADLQKEQLEELLQLDQRLFSGFLLLRGMLTVNEKGNVKEELNFVYQNYCFLLSERRNYLELEKKIKIY